MEHTVRWTGGSARVTISGGVAAFPASARSVEALIAAADAALYRAKADGRNRVNAAEAIGGPARA
jgi:diguanylate cyclase (GGDEF)-like protein